MGDVTVNVISTTPQKARRSVGIGGCIGRDTSAGWLSTYENPFLLQRDSFADSTYYQALDSTSLLKAAIDNFFSQENCQAAWFYRFGTGLGGAITDEPALETPDGTITRFSTQQSPVSAITSVKIDYNDGLGLETIDPADWTANLDGTLYDGSITFSGTWTHGGDVHTTAPDDSNVYISYTYDPIGTAFKALRELDIQFIWFAYDPTEMTVPYTYSGVSLLQDVRYGSMEAKRCDATNNYRIFIAMLPKDKQPSDLDTGFGDGTVRYFRLWSTSQCSDKHTSIGGHRSTDDVGSAFGGVVCGIEPQMNLDKQPIKVTMDTKFEATAVKNFELAGMWCIDRPREANFSLRLHKGFTTDRTSANYKFIDYIRVIDDIRFSLIVDLWAALASNTVRMNKSGMALLRSYIEAVFLEKKMLGRIDGLQKIVIPLEELLNKSTRTDAEEIVVQNAKANREILGIKVTYVYSGNPETLTINLGSV